MKRCGRLMHRMRKLPTIFVGKKEMQCELELINQATVKTGSLRTKTDDIFRYDSYI